MAARGAAGYWVFALPGFFVLIAITAAAIGIYQENYGPDSGYHYVQGVARQELVGNKDEARLLMNLAKARNHDVLQMLGYVARDNTPLMPNHRIASGAQLMNYFTDKVDGRAVEIWVYARLIGPVVLMTDVRSGAVLDAKEIPLTFCSASLDAEHRLHLELRLFDMRNEAPVSQVFLATQGGFVEQNSNSLNHEDH